MLIFLSVWLFSLDYNNIGISFVIIVTRTFVARLLLKTIAILGIVISIFTIVYYVSLLKINVVMLRVCKTGIDFNDGFASIGVIAWDDIVSVTLGQSPVRGFDNTVNWYINVTLKQLHKYVKKLPRFAQIAYRVLHGYDNTKITIPFNSTSSKPDAVLSSIIAMKDKYSVHNTALVSSHKWIVVSPNVLTKDSDR
jgi:hypothetical protein